MWSWSVAVASTPALVLAALLFLTMQAAQVLPGVPLIGWRKSPAGFVRLQEVQNFSICGFWGSFLAFRQPSPDPGSSGKSGVQRPSSGTNSARERRIGTS